MMNSQNVPLDETFCVTAFYQDISGMNELGIESINRAGLISSGNQGADLVALLYCTLQVGLL